MRVTDEQLAWHLEEHGDCGCNECRLARDLLEAREAKEGGWHSA